MDTGTRVVTAAAQRRERWRNGAGWTREIHAAAGPGDALGWSWRLSIAEIDADAPFSSFPGVDRELVLLSGNGLRLRFGDGDGGVAELLPPHDRLRFAGERSVTGELLDGPTTDFNLMWRRDAVAAELWHRPLVGPMVLFVDPGTTWAVHLAGGQARFGAESGLPSLAAGDTAILEATQDCPRHRLDGAGEVLLVRVRRLPSVRT